MIVTSADLIDHVKPRISAHPRTRPAGVPIILLGRCELIHRFPMHDRSWPKAMVWTPPHLIGIEVPDWKCY